MCSICVNSRSVPVCLALSIIQNKNSLENCNRKFGVDTFYLGDSVFHTFINYDRKVLFIVNSNF